MKKLWLLSTLVLLSAQNLWAQKTIKAEALPTTLEDFITFRDRVATTPEGGAAVFTMALLIYTKDQELGEKALTIALDRSCLAEGNVHKGYKPPNSINYHLKNLQGKKYIARSYVLGTSPKKGYRLPKTLKYKVSQNPHSQQPNGDIKVFVHSTGADSPRPITMRKNNRGIWKAYNYNSVFVGVRPAVANVDDDL